MIKMEISLSSGDKVIVSTDSASIVDWVHRVTPKTINDYEWWGSDDGYLFEFRHIAAIKLVPE